MGLWNCIICTNVAPLVILALWMLTQIALERRYEKAFQCHENLVHVDHSLLFSNGNCIEVVRATQQIVEIGQS